MDSEKILFCYREDKVKKPWISEIGAGKMLAFVPCVKKFALGEYPIRVEKVKRQIEKIYHTTGAESLWLDDKLCDYLHMEPMEWPESLLYDWLLKIPDFHTLIFADSLSGLAKKVIPVKIEKLAAAAVVCYEENLSDYDEIAADLYREEGLVLQKYTYEELRKNKENILERFVIKGRAAVLDLDGRRSFWDKRLSKDMGYYSFEDWNRLFLDTCRKNSYNTLTK